MLYKVKINHIGMFVLTIIINSIAIILILNNRNPLITFFVATIFLITPTIIAQIIEGYMQIAVEDERRALIINEASRMTVNHYIISAISVGVLLIIVSLVTKGEGWSIRAISFGGITILTTGLLIAWVSAFSMDVQQKYKSRVYPKVNLKDIIFGILSVPLILLYMNHYAVLFSGDENSVLSSYIDIEQNWFPIYFILASLNFIAFRIYITKFGPLDEMHESLTRTSSIFTLKLATLIFLTISFLVFIMYLIQADQDLLWIGVPTFISFILLRGDFFLNINRATSQFS